MKDIFRFCELDEFEIFDGTFKRINDLGKIEVITENFKSSNLQYKKELTEEEINRITDIMKDSLVQFEYG